MDYFDKAETWDRATLETVQLARLKTTIQQASRAPFYAKRLAESGVSADNLRSLEDIRRIPFTSKDDLRSQYPYGLATVPHSEFVRMHCSSGTTGTPVAVCYTQPDINSWADLMARCLYMAGVRKDDVFQNMSGYGLFTGGLGAHAGGEAMGCSVIPTSSGNTERQIMFIRDLNATILCCTPSYAAYIGETMKEMGLTPDQIPLKAGIFGAEAWSEEMRQDIQNTLGIKAYDIYGLTELSGPGVAFECSAQSGMHINEDHFIAEIIDPETGEVLPDGQQGELVFTSITKEAFPLLRYRTRDICVLSHEKCSCGRTHVKMTKPRGRTDDMLIIRGVNVFPSQIETVLLNHGYPANYQIIVDRVRSTDTLDVQVEMTPEMFTDNMGEIERRQKELVDGLRSMLGLAAKVTLVAPKSIVRSEGKAVRVIDKRKI